MQNDFNIVSIRLGDSFNSEFFFLRQIILLRTISLKRCLSFCFESLTDTSSSTSLWKTRTRPHNSHIFKYLRVVLRMYDIVMPIQIVWTHTKGSMHYTVTSELFETLSRTSYAHCRSFEGFIIQHGWHSVRKFACSFLSLRSYSDTPIVLYYTIIHMVYSVRTRQYLWMDRLSIHPSPKRSRKIHVGAKLQNFQFREISKPLYLKPRVPLHSSL